MELNQISIADLPSLSFHLALQSTQQPPQPHLHSITAQTAHQQRLCVLMLEEKARLEKKNKKQKKLCCVHANSWSVSGARILKCEKRRRSLDGAEGRKTQQS